ncbi:aconitate hydratase [Kocuria palustris]|jgi:aconitate hydratase|uniref:aconitate hydratase n=1 Tax=Kocuria palustris TaxID=71999 RepID=UPI0019D2F822|nr:aconitate hydratase [Kocuria palustris]MBN6754259.1 aconitate hydratase [Kocuria palustris]MBN6759195.1 aconitate hydratase [Kocuria palustris]MBN6764235.1 aconitate hydratase [Kocuria palustris]MBN6783738.1 aconitate hydratase [Kocuria palustris]MBN6800220.1 aconitate hydratase [Kocuria palustris]
MGKNLTQKLLGAHLASGRLDPGTDITVAVDQVLIEDATGTMTALQFEMIGVDEVAVPLAVMYVDHNVLQIDDKNMQDHHYLQTFSARYGLRYSPPGHGISHYIHLERFARPGHLLIGADSHTSMAGAVGMFATGAGGLEVAVAMAGYGFDFVCPEVVGVELTGRLSPHVEAKDVVLEILRRHGVRGGRGRVFEFHGEGVETLSTTARATICNMIIESGATTAVFPSDDETRRWLTAQGREEEYQPLSADTDAGYDVDEGIDLSALRPLVAVPHSPGNVHAVADLEPTDVVQVCVGSSVNSSYEDLATVAAILKDRSVDPRVHLTVTPGSRQVLQTIIASGVYEDLMRSGARMLEPVCGPCVGIGQAPLAGAPSLRTFNRNFPGRSGTAEDNVYLCSPSTAAVSALAGRITDPSDLGELQLRPATPPDPETHDLHITFPLPEERRRQVHVEQGPNLVPPPRPTPLPENLDAKVVVVVGDDISTGDMAPDGAVAMSVWSNIAVCARFMFRRLDPGFHDRALEWGGGIIVGGENYGQGSSREHAALIPLHLGIRAVAARSFARIHRRNLIATGIVPLLLPTSSDAPAPEVGQRWSIDGLTAAVASGATSVSARVGEPGDGAAPLTLGLDLSPAERSVLAAGGLLAQVRDGGRTQLPVAASAVQEAGASRG